MCKQLAARAIRENRFLIFGAFRCRMKTQGFCEDPCDRIERTLLLSTVDEKDSVVLLLGAVI